MQTIIDYAKQHTKCLCDKYFEEDNKPIICRNCKSIRCDDCWKHGTCPKCFLECPKKIVYYRYLKEDDDRGCPICMEEYQNASWMTMGCGHSICYPCYNQMLQNQKNSSYSDMYCPHKDFGEYNPYVTQYSNLISSCPSCNQRVTCCIMKYGGKPHYPIKTKLRIYQWDLYSLYLHLLNQGMLPRKELIQAMEQYRIFIEAKVETNDFEAQILSPSPIVDVIWHAHILNSMNYIPFCQHIVKDIPGAPTYIHHNPDGEFEEEAKRTRYRNMLDWLFSNNYYVNANVWLPIEKKEDFENNSDMQMYVKTINGKTITLNVNPSDKVWIIKVLLKYLNGTPVNDMRLIYAGRNLENGKTLGSYNIQQDSTIHLVMMLRGC